MPHHKRNRWWRGEGIRRVHWSAGGGELTRRPEVACCPPKSQSAVCHQLTFRSKKRRVAADFSGSWVNILQNDNLLESSVDTRGCGEWAGSGEPERDDKCDLSPNAGMVFARTDCVCDLCCFRRHRDVSTRGSGALLSKGPPQPQKQAGVARNSTRGMQLTAT